MNTKTQASPENIACPKWLQDMTIEQMHRHYAPWSQRQRTEWNDAIEEYVHTEGPDKGKICIEGMFNEDLFNHVLQIYHATQQWKTLTRINEPRFMSEKTERLNEIEHHLMRHRLRALELSWYGSDRDEEHTQIKTALGVNRSIEFTINKEE